MSVLQQILLPGRVCYTQPVLQLDVSVLQPTVLPLDVSVPQHTSQSLMHLDLSVLQQPMLPLNASVQRRFILKEDQAFFGFAGIGTERKSFPASVSRFPQPQPVPPFVLDAQ